MPVRHLRTTVVLAAIGALHGLPLAQAAVLVDNLGEATRGTTILESTTWATQSFYTAATPVLLNSIEVKIGEAVDPNVVAELRADNGANAPGALLTTFSLSGLSFGPTQTETLTPVSGDVPLAANLGYWLVLGVQGSGTFGFSYAEGNAMTGPGTLGNYAYSSDGGASWTGFNADNPYHLRVNVTAIPEPGSAMLMLLGAAVLGGSIGRQARAVRAGR